MFGKAKTAADILKLINELPEDEQDKLFSALVEDEATEEKIEEAKETVEETPAEEAPAEVETEETAEEAEETPAEEPAEVTEGETEVEAEVEAEGEAEKVTEEAAAEEPVEETEHEDANEALKAEIASLKDLVAALTERVDNIVENSEHREIGMPSRANLDGEGEDTMSAAERNYFAKTIRR